MSALPPIFFATLSLVIGAALGFGFSAPTLPMVWIFSLSLLSAFALALVRHSKFCFYASRTFLLLAFFFGGMWRAAAISREDAVRAEYFSAACEENKNVVVLGEVRGSGTSPYDNGKCFHFYILHPSCELDGTSAPLPYSGISVTWYGRQGLLPRNGSNVRLECKLKELKIENSQSEPGHQPLPWCPYRAVTSLRSTTFVPPSGLKLSALGRVFPRLIERLREHAITFGGEGDVGAMLRAMFLGRRCDLGVDLANVFRFSGTIHIFAISGLHVVVIAVLFRRVFAYIFKSIWTRSCLPLIFLGVYVIAVGAPPSAVRAGVMVALYYLLPCFLRCPIPLGVLSLAALLLLTFDFRALRDLSFILSFAMVGGLFFFTPPVHTIISAILDPNHVAEMPLLKGTKKLLARAYSSFIKTLSVVIASTLVSFALTAYFFGYMLPFSMFANLLIVPGTGILIFFSAVAWLLDILTFHSAAVPLMFARGLATLMRIFANWIADLPGGVIPVSWTISTLVFWLGGFGVALYLLAKRLSRGKNSARDA